MHSDEYRDPDLVSRQIIEMEVADPLQLYEKYVGLLGGNNSSGVARSEGSGDIQDLKRRISAAHAALGGVKAENQELRNKLEELRDSRTMKAGKVVSSPVRWAKGTKRELKPIGKKAVRQLKSSVRTDIFPLVRKGATKAGGIKRKFSTSKAPENLAPNGALPPRTLDTPVSDFESKPSSKSFELAVNYLWYNQGAISGTHEFMQNNLEWIDSASEKLGILSGRIASAYRLQKSGVKLPKRSRGAAYVAEPERIMYCVHSTPVFNSNGYSTRTRGVAEGIVEAGGDVVVVARSGYPWDSKVDRAKPKPSRFETKIGPVQYVHNPGPNLNRDGLDNYFAEVADTFVREARRSRPSIIQAASNHRTAIPALIAARRVGIAFVYEVRGLWEITEASTNPGFENSERFALMRELETFVAVQADKVLAITEEVADELVSRGVSRERISVTPNGVNPNEFLPIPRDKQYAEYKKYDPNRLTIGFAGSFVGYEGLDLLLQASALLDARGTEHQVVLAGSGAVDAELRALNKQLGNKNVYFLGRLPQNQMVRLMSTFDIVACPRTSTQVTELVSPLKPLESFSASIATLLSDVSPNRTLAGAEDEDRRAHLFPAGDVDALANSLQELIEDEDLRRDLGRTARLWVVRQRAWKQIGQSILENHRSARKFYDAAISEGPLLSELKVGVIADEFTRTSLQATFDAVLIDRENWEAQLEKEGFDFLFVESAWEGNSGQWHRGVGYYGEEENADLFQLLEACNMQGIPTVFWNKEDPVHFSRFAPTAARFDHVFTTDANMISKYRGLEGSRNRTVSSHSFYSQPHLHNPLPSKQEFSPTIAYAGSYYGERYADRSTRLDALLDSAFPYGLELYDRQANNPDSPYKFPTKYQRFVRGALPYIEVIETYKAHLAHLNVNSVENSPSMFSRRVVEIPACGGVLMSAEGRGIAETLGNVLATSNDKKVYSAWLHSWTNHPTAWFTERWMQMRAVFRAHTSSTALTILARTIGFSTTNPGLPNYALRVSELKKETAAKIAGFSVPPAVVISDNVSEAAVSLLQIADIAVAKSANDISEKSDWIGELFPEASRTFYEDLLTATTYGEWSYLEAKVGEIESHETPLVQPVSEPPSEYSLTRVEKNLSGKDDHGLRMSFPTPGLVSPEIDLASAKNSAVNQRKQRVLIAGHDLKFISPFMDYLRGMGHSVETDIWESHTKHDEEQSEIKIAAADVIIAEWGLGNAVWYSRHIEPHQRLIVRVHSQELFRPYLSQINHGLVDSYVFVGELIRQAAIRSHGVPWQKTLVVPNGVETEKLDLPKDDDAKHALGLVGIIPQSKRFDLALDLLEELMKRNTTYTLRVKGKMPSDYPWMQNRPEELEYYERQLKRAEDINAKSPGTVIFDGFGNDMPEWFRKVGIALSTSDFESFHFTVPDGVASGARPVALNWPGADLIYPEGWLGGSVEQLANSITASEWTVADQEDSREWVKNSFDVKHVFETMHGLITERNAE